MSSWTPPSDFTLAQPDVRQADASYRRWLMWAYAVVIGCLTFNFALAFINTNVARISETHVILSELVLLSAGLALAANRKASLYTVLVLFFGYMTLILALRPEFDQKAIRDIIIPIAFYFIGRGMRSIEDADRLIIICAVIVVSVGLFEFLLLDVFTGLVNIFQYYVARGSLSADDNFVAGSTLFISSTRVGGRYFLAFLGDIRASSVFLEPVTMGNFGAFLFLWALFRTDMRFRYGLFALAVTVIILGDARFGMIVCLAFAAVAPFYRAVPKLIWALLPFAIMVSLALYGGWTRETTWEDNLPGRVLHAALLMVRLTPESTFGIAADLPFLDDNGYAYTLSQIGLIGMASLWFLFVFAPQGRDEAFRFKALAVTYICLLMTVSNSFYSIKLAALFWLAAGAADAWAPKPAAEAPKADERDLALSGPVARLRRDFAWPGTTSP